MFTAERTVGIARITAVASQFGYLLSKEFLCKLYTMHKTGTLIECVERKLLDERQTVNLDVVALGSKLDLLYFLATDDWTYVWLVDAYDTIRNALLGIATLMMLALLTVYLRYRLYFCKLLVGEDSCTGIFSAESS